MTKRIQHSILCQGTHNFQLFRDGLTDLWGSLSPSFLLLALPTVCQISFRGHIKEVKYKLIQHFSAAFKRVLLGRWDLVKRGCGDYLCFMLTQSLQSWVISSWLYLTDNFCWLPHYSIKGTSESQINTGFKKIFIYLKKWVLLRKSGTKVYRKFQSDHSFVWILVTTWFIERNINYTRIQSRLTCL